MITAKRLGQLLGRGIFLAILLGVFSVIKWIIGFESTIILLLLMIQTQEKE